MEHHNLHNSLFTGECHLQKSQKSEKNCKKSNTNPRTFERLKVAYTFFSHLLLGYTLPFRLQLASQQNCETNCETSCIVYSTSLTCESAQFLLKTHVQEICQLLTWLILAYIRVS